VGVGLTKCYSFRMTGLFVPVFWFPDLKTLTVPHICCS
jgi:hypothetical protein